jgi:hypothetical protein
MSKTFVIALVLVLSQASVAWNQEQDVVEVETEGKYLMGESDTREKAKALALFEAKSKAVDVAARYLAAKGLIETYERNKREIYALATDEIETTLVKEEWEPDGRTFMCVLIIRAKVRDSDLVKAEMESRKLERADVTSSFREELEPEIPRGSDPARDISKAYRLLRRKEWRMAVIYLDRLEGKYPNWGVLQMAKAMAFYAMHQPGQMKSALEKACHLGSPEACDDLKVLKKVHSIALGL